MVPIECAGSLLWIDQFTEEDQAKATPFQEYRSLSRNATIFQQTPYSVSTHCQLNAYIELDAEKKWTEKVVVFFFKTSTCNAFCDLIRRQLFNGVFKDHELELYLADDEGNFDDKNEPPPGNELISRIVDIGLDSFYFRIANAWQLSTTDKVAMERRIQDHKRGLKEYVEPKDDSDDDSESATPIPQSQMAGQHSPRRETSGARGCCTIL